MCESLLEVLCVAYCCYKKKRGLHQYKSAMASPLHVELGQTHPTPRSLLKPDPTAPGKKIQLSDISFLLLILH